VAKLHSIDARIKNVSVVSATSHAYCIKSTKPTTPVYHKSGPAGDIVPNAC